MRKILIAVVVLALLAAIPLAGALFFLPPRIAGEIATMLSDRTGHDVQVGGLGWSFTPMLQLVGREIRVAGPEPEEPLIVVGEFSVDARFGELLEKPRRIRSVHLTELAVHIPRGRRDDDNPHLGSAHPTGVDDAGQHEESMPAGIAASPAAPPVPDDAMVTGESSTPIIVDQVIADRVELQIARTDKPPRVFDIHSLRLGSVALDRPISFDASLTNPKPVGEVVTQGEFGPWNKDEVRDTPISGDYEFTDADLGEFKGISGILASTGTFGGTFGEIEASGEADIPDFHVSVGQIVPLQTRFEVAVGDRGGDVQLETVHSRFHESELIAVGEVVRVEGARGRSVVVDVVSRNARVEDLVGFAMKSETPPLTGPIELATVLEIPPGERPVIERMRLTGDFAISEATFTSVNIQETLGKISRIGRGQTDAEEGSSVVSDLQGDFELVDAELRFSSLTFAVPGMQVSLVGSLGLQDESLDLGGQVRLDQSVSQLVSQQGGREGAARWLRLVDPLFQQGEAGTGTVVPITISGSRSKPSFGVGLAELKPDWRRLLGELTGQR